MHQGSVKPPRTLRRVDVDVDRYLGRIGFVGTPSLDLAGLTALQRAHMTAVPFENLDIVFGPGVSVDQQRAVDKVVAQRRGGWCFEVNGAFAALLRALGFDVIMLGAAVLLDGPSTVIEHLALEVSLDEPYLADVGFGENFITPLALNRAGPQDGGNGVYEFLPSPQGTTLAEHVEGIPEARYRFKRVAHQLSDFNAISTSMQADATRSWNSKPFATRLLGGGPDRVTLRDGRLKVTRHGEETVTAIAGDRWDQTLDEWFEMSVPSG